MRRQARPGPVQRPKARVVMPPRVALGAALRLVVLVAGVLRQLAQVRRKPVAAEEEEEEAAANASAL